MKKILFENKNNGLIGNLKRNKMRWEEKLESIQKTDIIIIWLLLIKVTMCFFAIWFTWIYCKIIKICFNLKMKNLRSKMVCQNAPKHTILFQVVLLSYFHIWKWELFFFVFLKPLTILAKSLYCRCSAEF